MHQQSNEKDTSGQKLHHHHGHRLSLLLGQCFFLEVRGFLGSSARAWNSALAKVQGINFHINLWGIVPCEV